MKAEPKRALQRERLKVQSAAPESGPMDKLCLAGAETISPGYPERVSMFDAAAGPRNWPAPASAGLGGMAGERYKAAGSTEFVAASDPAPRSRSGTLGVPSSTARGRRRFDTHEHPHEGMTNPGQAVRHTPPAIPVAPTGTRKGKGLLFLTFAYLLPVA